MKIIGAGTFGADPNRMSGYPWHYNLIEIKVNSVRVNSRKREKLNGVWEDDAQWPNPDGGDPLPYYEFEVSGD